MPPNFMLGVYNNETAYQKNFSSTPGYYMTGDQGYFDNDGYLFVVSRIDDVINTAGHRLSTLQMEENLLKNPYVVEAAVIGKEDKLKG